MKNFIFIKNSLLVFLTFILSFSNLYAQEEAESAAALAKELANPNATRGQMFNNIDYVRYGGDVPDAGQNSIVYNFQPSLPIPLSEGVNLFVRPLIPVYISQPALGGNGFEKKAALGNISADVAIGKTWPSKWMTLAGVFAGFPTATAKELRSNFTTLGPEIFVGKVTSWGFAGVLLNHAWSVGGTSDADPNSFTLLPDAYWTTTGGRTSASVTAGQYMYVVNLKNAWQITSSPTFAYNHNAEDGNRFTFPIGTGVKKMTNFGKLPVGLGVEYWYYAATPNSFGPRHQVRFKIIPVVSLPW